MISGPFTDEIVSMLRSSEPPTPVYGDVLLNGGGIYGVYDGNLVYVSGETVFTITYADFVKTGARVLIFPEPYGDGFRITTASGTVWIPEFTKTERDFLRETGYTVHPAVETVAKIGAALGQKKHPLYPISCKTGLMAKAEAEKIAICLKKVM